MAFPRGAPRAPAPIRIRAAVFAVGRRVYVARGRSGRVTLSDGAARPLTSLDDGAEVTILAWIPGWAGATRYRVRVTESGLEGWLPVGDLCATRSAISSPPDAPPPPAVRPGLRADASDTSGRRFGQRF